MAIRRITQGLGLVTEPSALDAGDVPKGAMRVASNVLLHRMGAIQPRPGFGDTTGLTTPRAGLWRPLAAWPYDGDIIVQSKNGTSYRAELGSAATIAAASLAPYDPSVAVRSDAFEARGNLYVTSALGLVKLTSAAGGVDSLAGMPTNYQAIFTWARSGTADRNAIAPGAASTAYRHLWKNEDASGYIRRSAPSPREVVPGEEDWVEFERIILPSGIVAGDSFELYRSISAAPGVTPSDEMYLALEHIVTAAEVTAGYIKELVIVDDVPDARLGAVLYTSPSQGGILGSNDIPPISTTCAFWQGCGWYGNTKEKYIVSVDVIRAHDSNSTPSQNDLLGLSLISPTGDFSASSDKITAVSTVSGMKVGQYLYDFSKSPTEVGTYIPALTKVTSIISGVSLTQASLSDGDTISVSEGRRVFTWRLVPASYGDILIGANDSECAVNLAAELSLLDLLIEAGTSFTLSALANTPSTGDVLISESTSGYGVELTVTGSGQAVANTVSMDAVSSATGTQTFWAGDWLTVNGVEFFAASNQAALAYFVNAGLPATDIARRIFRLPASGDVATIAAGIAIVVEAYALVQDTAFDVRKPAGLDSANLFLARTTTDQGSFSIQCTVRPEAFRPNLASAYTGPDTRHRNRLYWSKLQEPEAVPPVNFVDIGRTDADILALVPLTDAMLVFKTDGLFRVSGVAPSGWVVDDLDLYIRLLDADATAVLDNICYAWTDRGILAIGEGGVGAISSAAIGHTIRELGRVYPLGADAAPCVWLTAHQRLGLILAGSNSLSPKSEVTSEVYVRHGSGAWTTWPVAWRMAVYDHATDRLIIGTGSTGEWAVVYERDDEDAAVSYQDEITGLISPPAWDSPTVVRVSGGDIPWTPTACDVVHYVEDGTHYEVTSVADGGNGDYLYTLALAVPSVTCNDFLTDEAGDFLVDEAGDFLVDESRPCEINLHQGYTCTMTWQTQDIPGIGNRWQEIHAQLLDGDTALAPTWTLTLGGQTERDSVPVGVDSTISSDVVISRPVRVGVPRDMVRAAHVYPFAQVCSAGVLWRLGELQLHHTGTSRRVAR